MSTPEPEPAGSRHSPRRRVRVVVARTVAVVALAVVVVGMVLVGNSAGYDRTGMVPLVIGAIVFVASIPFCGLNSPRPR